MTGPRTVLLLERYGVKGGAEVVLCDIVDGLNPDRFRPFVVCLLPGAMVEELRRFGVEVGVVPVGRINTIDRVLDVARQLWRLRAECRRLDVALIHVNHTGGRLPVLFGEVLRLLIRRPVVWHVHDPPDDVRSWKARLFIFVVSRLHPKWVMFATPAALQSYEQLYPRLGPHSLVLPGVDPIRPPPTFDAESLRLALGVPLEVPIVSVISRLTPRKGHADLIRAVADLSTRGVHVHAVVCGGLGPSDYAEQLEALCRGLDVEDQVTFTGYVSDELREALLYHSDAYVHTAHFEPLGLAVLEAMAAGKPVIAADASGPAFSIQHGTNGLLYPRGDSAALADALESLIRDEELAARLGGAARERASDFSRPTMVASVESIWSTVLTTPDLRASTTGDSSRIPGSSQ